MPTAPGRVNASRFASFAGLENELSYDDAVAVLRGALVEVSGNVRVFAIRSRLGAGLLSGRGWAELARIETKLERDLEDTLRLELRAEPWSWWMRTQALYRGLWLGLHGEPRLVRGLFDNARTHPVEQWRQGAPQLEASLWPLFVARTHHLANILALALDEPAPFDALFWHPSRQEFRS